MGVQPVIALVYDDDAYVEAGGAALGLMGRHVAGRSFLDAYLSHGTFTEMAALVRARESRPRSLVRAWHEQPSRPAAAANPAGDRRDGIVRELVRGSPANVLHAPQPPDPSLAWRGSRPDRTRSHWRGSRTRCARPRPSRSCKALVTAPFEPYDAVVCTSRAVATHGPRGDQRLRRVSVRELGRSGQLAAPYRFPFGSRRSRWAWTLIASAPALPAERAAARQLLGVGDDEVAILYVGRLSHHAKAHPFPIYRGALEAARASGRRIHLILAGWAAHPAIRDAFETGRATSPQTCEPRSWTAASRTSAARSGTRPTCSSHRRTTFRRRSGWPVFEAMASGLPVVASDWDGYRDLVVDGHTGFLVPTAMVAGATAAATARLLDRRAEL